jgi:hypothetical protein
MTIIAPRVSSKLFDWSAKDKQFTVEASTLGKNAIGQVYDDACDEGFTMVSARTGKTATFYLVSRERYQGEVTGWTLKPTGETLRKQPQLKGVTVRVFND